MTLYRNILDLIRNRQHLYITHKLNKVFKIILLTGQTAAALILQDAAEGHLE